MDAFLMLTKTRIEKIVSEIIDKIFTNGFGQEAERLMLVLPGKGDGGGWGRGPLRDLIAKELSERLGER